MYQTKNDLPEQVRAQLIGLCNARLADAIDLQTQCKQAHWNVKGPDFISLHGLFDRVSDDARGYVDDIAERAVQLGGVADGTLGAVAKRTTLPPYGTAGGNGRAHIEAMAVALAAFGVLVRQAIGISAELNDADSADLFTEISRGTDKWLWFIEAHVQADR